MSRPGNCHTDPRARVRKTKILLDPRQQIGLATSVNVKLKVLRRETTAVSSLPALVISTEASDQDVAAARAAGANFYLVKPVSQERLVEHVSIMCGLPA